MKEEDEGILPKRQVQVYVYVTFCCCCVKRIKDSFLAFRKSSGFSLSGQSESCLSIRRPEGTFKSLFFFFVYSEEKQPPLCIHNYSLRWEGHLCLVGNRHACMIHSTRGSGFGTLYGADIHREGISMFQHLWPRTAQNLFSSVSSDVYIFLEPDETAMYMREYFSHIPLENMTSFGPARYICYVIAFRMYKHKQYVHVLRGNQKQDTG